MEIITMIIGIVNFIALALFTVVMAGALAQAIQLRDPLTITLIIFIMILIMIMILTNGEGLIS